MEEQLNCLHSRSSLLEDSVSICGLLPPGHSEARRRCLCPRSSGRRWGLGGLTPHHHNPSRQQVPYLWDCISWRHWRSHKFALLSGHAPGRRMGLQGKLPREVTRVNSLCTDHFSLVPTWAWFRTSGGHRVLVACCLDRVHTSSYTCTEGSTRTPCRRSRVLTGSLDAISLTSHVSGS